MEFIKAHNRNLKIFMLKVICNDSYNIDQPLSKEEIRELFYFRAIDFRDSFEYFFEKSGKKYVFCNKIKEDLRKMKEKHQKSMRVFEDVKAAACNIYRLFKIHENENVDNTEFRELLASLKDKLEILHWSTLPIYDENVMCNEGILPEENILKYYSDYFGIEDLFHWISENNNWKPSFKGDYNLDIEIPFKVFSRRWGHYDTYYIKRTLDGWYTRHIAIYGESKKDGTGALLNNLNHDYIKYPIDGIKYALQTLWGLADGSEMSIEELSAKMQEVADWITAVEQTVGRYQPEWCNYY